VKDANGAGALKSTRASRGGWGAASNACAAGASEGCWVDCPADESAGWACRTIPPSSSADRPGVHDLPEAAGQAHARRSAAGDETGGFVRRGRHAPISTHWFRVPGRIVLSPVNGILNWWDGIELWLSGLAFVLQAMVVMPVVLALAYVSAAALDALLGKGIQLMRGARHADDAPG
jgi:hypothetical protein